LRDALGTRESAPRVEWLNRDGLVRLPPDSAGDYVVPELPGYRPWGEPGLPPRLVPVAGGALHGKRIVIDPDGGGENPAGTGKSGTRAAGLNLDVSRALAAMLTAAGAEVRLTRAGDYALSEVERVQLSEAFRADRFLRVGHRAEAPRIGHYFSSAAGKKWGEAVARELRRAGLPAPAPVEDAQYPLQQTSCPALYVSAARVDDPASENRLLAPGTIRSQAYALYLALAREWAPSAEWPADSLTVRDRAGNPLAGATVTLGGSLVLETDSGGQIRYARTEPGPLEAAVVHPRLKSRSVLLDSQRGTVLTGSRGNQDPDDP
jgi:N-acetylmuramoyl-L-alanine amidase